MLGVIGKSASSKRTALPRHKTTVALLAYEGISPFQLAGPLLVFGSDGSAGLSIEFMICSIHGASIHTTVGLHISAPHALEEMERADVVVIPGWLGTDTPIHDSLRTVLLRARDRGAQIIGLGLGVFALARTGMLDGKRATTHWTRSESFASQFPRVRLERDILYARDGNIWTSAGGAVAIDVCTLVLREVCGPAAATRVAHRIISAPSRNGNQHQHVERPPIFSSSDGRLRTAVDWVRDNLHADHAVSVLAARANMSPRTFSRRFKQIYGTSYLQWLLSEQLERAQILLETTDLTVEGVAASVGFRSAVALRRHFRRAFGCTPSKYRKDHYLDAPLPLGDAA